MTGATSRREPRSRRGAGDREPDLVPARRMSLGNRRELVHASIQRRGARWSGPELDRRIENQPHDIAIFALELTNHELAAASGGLPGDTLEGIAAHVLA